MIVFVTNYKAFLPGVHAYMRFFSGYNIPCKVMTPQELGNTPRTVEWFLMGTDTAKSSKGVVKIHEYLSTSTSPFRRLKDFCKIIINSKPDFRIYQNEFVRSVFNHRDGIPYGFRTEGVSPLWISARGTGGPKQFDFIYTGELSAARRPWQLIDRFTLSDMQQHSLLLLGKDYATWQKKYERYPNIRFEGPVAHEQVREYILQARFAINYIPDREPFNRLSSTKFLEYAACGIPVISSDYLWMREFQQRYGGEYFYLRPDLSNLSWENVNNFRYSFPVLHNWTWEQQIRGSGVLEFLKEKFPEWDFGKSGESDPV